MRLDDPFGRLRRRDEAEYARLRSALQQAGARSAADGRRVVAGTGRRVRYFAAVVLVSAAAGSLLFPGLAPVTVALAVLLLAVAGNAWIKARRYVDRLIREGELPE